MENQIADLQNYLSNKQHHLLTFTSKSSEIKVDYDVPIELNPEMNYKAALLWFSAYNTVFNIIEGVNNRFPLHYLENGIPKYSYDIKLPSGAYEITQINDEIQRQIKHLDASLCEVEISVQKTTSKAIIQLKNAHTAVGFDQNNTIRELLGFNSKLIKIERLKNPNDKGVYYSDHIVNITNLTTINIECSLVHNSYVNGKHGNTIYSFPSYTVPTGYKIIERIAHPIYLPVHKTSSISSVIIRIVDENGKIVNFNEEEIALAIELKQV